ncbi:MAG: histidine kinase dimerization/phosphoacceptor domain -containing protein [Beijerinckiaceae bacterium]|nr:histidine kinase dimerization/phosphoacceptor domain -containing protein [Beijerinckiaceae bacterium]
MEDASRVQIIREFLDQIPEAITLATAPDVTIVHVSKMGQEFLHKPASDLCLPLGQHSAGWKLFRHDGSIPDDLELPLSRATRDGEDVRAEEWIVRTSDGEQKTILCNASPIRNSQGDIVAGAIAWRDITELKRVQAELARLSEERDLLLRELNHRTMNTIAMLKSLIDLQTHRVSRDQDPVEVLQSISRRVAAVGALYHHLHLSGSVEVIEISAFLPAVVAELRGCLFDGERGDTLSLEAAEQVFSSEAATSIALIVNELVTNACMHAYKADERRTVAVAFQCVDGQFVLSVVDDGCGLSDGFSPSQSNSGLGMKVIQGMARRLGGDVSVERTDGRTMFMVRWRDQNQAQAGNKRVLPIPGAQNRLSLDAISARCPADRSRSAVHDGLVDNP